MKKRFAAILLSLCMVLTFIPSAAFAADGDTIYVGAVELKGTAENPAYALTTEDGAVKTDGADESNYNVKWDGSTLTLNNAKVTSGASKVNNLGSWAAIYCKTDFKIELTGSSTVIGPYLENGSGDESFGIYSKGDVTIVGSGTLNVNGGNIIQTQGYGTVLSHGLYSRDGNITINSGTVNATGGYISIDIENDEYNASSSGIYFAGVTINGGIVNATGGNITNSGGDAESIGIESYLSISITGGEVTVNGGTVDITKFTEDSINIARSKGLHAYMGDISITGSIVNATGGDITNKGEYAESYGIYAANATDENHNEPGDIIISNSHVEAKGGEVAAGGDVAAEGDGTAYSCGIYTDTIVTIADNSFVKATTGTAQASYVYSYGISHDEGLYISGSQVTASGANAAITTDEPVMVSSNVSDKALEVKTGENEESAEEIGGSPFIEETDIRFRISDEKYFHSELVTPRAPKPVEADIHVGNLMLTASTAEPAYALTSEEGKVTTAGATEENYNIKWDGETLTLRDATVTQSSYEFDNGEAAAAIYSLLNLEVEFTGNNTVTGPAVDDKTGDTCESYGIFVDEGDLTVSGSGTLNIAGGDITKDNEDNDVYSYESYGIYSNVGNITINGGTVNATGGSIYSNGKVPVYSEGIDAYDNVTIIGSKVEAKGGSINGSKAGSTGIYSHNGDITITDSTVEAVGGKAIAEEDGAYSHGFFSGDEVNITGGSVIVVAGRAECHDDPDNTTSDGMCAYNINISGGEVIAAVGLTAARTADGIYADNDINITGGSVTSTGPLYAVDGVIPQYSGGLFSETGDITITGKDTVVNANGGCADNGITAIAAGAGDIVIESGSVRANGAYGAYTGFTGLSNGLSALKDTDDDTGGNIIISGGNLAATGATDSIYYEGDLIARPSSENIAVSVLDNLIVDEDTGAPDWKAMEQNAAEIAGSPFTEETVLSRTSTEDKLYFSATDGSVYPDGSTDPDNPTDPDDTTDPDGSTGTSGNDNPTGQTGSGTQTGDANNAGDEINAGSSPKTGDEQNIALWILLLAFSGCFITRIYVYNKRKQD